MIEPRKFLREVRNQNVVTYVIWAVLLVELVGVLFAGRWMVVFVVIGTFALSLTPLVLAPRLGFRLPPSMVAAVAAFVFATLYLGEVFDFYGRYWWWDVVLHGFSALSFGFAGFLLVFIMFEGDRYAAPPWAIGILAFCFAVTIGVIWEIFEFAMDSFFGMNMQKSGLVDTMTDLIVDVIGAAIGGLIGALYLRGRALGSVAALFDDFVALNKRLFSRFKSKN